MRPFIWDHDPDKGPERPPAGAPRPERASDAVPGWEIAVFIVYGAICGFIGYLVGSN